MRRVLFTAVSLAAFAAAASMPAYAQQPSGRTGSQTQEFNMLGVTLGDAPEHVRSTLAGRGYRLVSDSQTGTRATPRMQVFSLSEGWRESDRIETLYHQTTDSYAVGFMRRVIDVDAKGGPVRRTYLAAMAKLYGQPALPVLGEKNKADALFYRSAESATNCFGFPMDPLSANRPPTLYPRSSVAGPVCQKGMAIQLIYEPHGNQRIQQVVQFVYDTRKGDAFTLGSYQGEWRPVATDAITGPSGISAWISDDPQLMSARMTISDDNVSLSFTNPGDGSLGGGVCRNARIAPLTGAALGEYRQYLQPVVAGQGMPQPSLLQCGNGVWKDRQPVYLFPAPGGVALSWADNSLILFKLVGEAAPPAAAFTDAQLRKAVTGGWAPVGDGCANDRGVHFGADGLWAHCPTRAIGT